MTTVVKAQMSQGTAGRSGLDAPSARASAKCPLGVEFGCCVDSLATSQLGCVGRMTRVSKGSLVMLDDFREGAAIGVVEGVMKLSMMLTDGRRQIVNLQFPGEIVMIHSPDSGAPLSLEAASQATLCVFDLWEIKRRNRFSGNFALFLNSKAWCAVHDMQKHLLTLGRRAPLERLASFLIELHAKSALPHEQGCEIDIPITRADISDYLGLGSETVSRLFTRLKSLSLISLPSPNRVIIRDRDALERIARGDVS